MPETKPYVLRGVGAARDGKKVHRGYFATAEQAALCVARSPEGREAAKRAAAAPPPAPPLTSEEARWPRRRRSTEKLTFIG